MITDHTFESKFETDICTFRIRSSFPMCARHRREHVIQTDYERALERIREMKADVALALVAIETLEEELERVRYERDLLREALDNQ